MVRRNGLERAIISIKVNGNPPKLCWVRKINGEYMVKIKSQDGTRNVPVDELEKNYRAKYGHDNTNIKKLY